MTTTSINLIQAIVDGIITPEQALQLQAVADNNAVDQAKTPKTKAPKAPKGKKTTKKQTKAEEPKGEYSYTKGGAIIQYAAKNTIRANNLRRINNAMDKLVAAGFCVSWTRIGGWVYIKHQKSADGKTQAEFSAVTLAKGWEFSKKHNAWIDKSMLAAYEDNFKA